MRKRIISLALAIIIVCSLSIHALASSASIPEIPEKMTGYLYNDESGSIEIVGTLIDARPVLANNTFAREANSSTNLQGTEWAATYEYTAVTPRSNHTVTVDDKDGAFTVHAYLTVHYVSSNETDVGELLLIGVSGRWEILSANNVSVESASVEYNCSGFSPDSGWVSQNKTRTVANNFIFQTNFTEKISAINGSLGAILTLNMLMGTTRRWTFTIDNTPFFNFQG